MILTPQVIDKSSNYVYIVDKNCTGYMYLLVLKLEAVRMASELSS